MILIEKYMEFVIYIGEKLFSLPILHMLSTVGPIKFLIYGIIALFPFSIITEAICALINKHVSRNYVKKPKIIEYKDEQKGADLETYVAYLLNKRAKRNGGTLYRNLIVDNKEKENTETEIDMVYVENNVAIAIECKYRGHSSILDITNDSWTFGKNEYITEDSPTGQNEHHIRYLRKFLGMQETKIVNLVIVNATCTFDNNENRYDQTDGCGNYILTLEGIHYDYYYYQKFFDQLLINDTASNITEEMKANLLASEADEKTLEQHKKRLMKKRKNNNF